LPVVHCACVVMPERLTVPLADLVYATQSRAFVIDQSTSMVPSALIPTTQIPSPGLM
jgi:hypothetical protein